MRIKVIFTLHAARVEKWISQIHELFLDNTLIKYTELDVEYTDMVTNAKHMNLPLEQSQRTTVLQLFVAY
jgi:hypothetical protein